MVMDVLVLVDENNTALGKYLTVSHFKSLLSFLLSLLCHQTALQQMSPVHQKTCLLSLLHLYQAHQTRRGRRERQISWKYHLQRRIKWVCFALYALTTSHFKVFKQAIVIYPDPAWSVPAPLGEFVEGKLEESALGKPLERIARCRLILKCFFCRWAGYNECFLGPND